MLREARSKGDERERYSSTAWRISRSLVMGLLIAGDSTLGAGDTLADRVLGQTDFIHNAANTSKSNSLFSPSATAIDSRGHLYIADAGNHRVLGWRSVASLANATPADLLIGQPDFASGGCNHGV